MTFKTGCQNPFHILEPTQPADMAAFALMLGRPKVLGKALGHWMCIVHCTMRARTKNMKRDPGTSGPHLDDTSIDGTSALGEVTRTYMSGAEPFPLDRRGSATLFGPSDSRNSTVLRANASVSF